MKIIKYLFLCTFFIASCLSAQEQYKVGDFKKVTSKFLKGDVTYIVHLPEGYDTSDKTYPVLYLMNGNSIETYLTAAMCINNLSVDRIPDMILVGISNTGVAAGHWDCPDSLGQVPKSQKFCDFLEKELLPEVNSKYRTNNYKILAGQSNAGIFTLYTFLFRTDIFNSYIIASPMLGWCPDFYINETKNFLQNNKYAGKKLYVNYGDLDYVEVLDHVEKFFRLFADYSADKSWYKIEEIKNEGHVPFVTINNGLISLFSKCTITAAMKKMSVKELSAHFEKVSKEYGFTINPKGNAIFDFAMDLRGLKKLDESIEWLKYLVTIEPKVPMYFYGMGIVYNQKGDRTNAKEALKKSLIIDPSFDRAKNLLKKIEDEEKKAAK